MFIYRFNYDNDLSETRRNDQRLCRISLTHLQMRRQGHQYTTDSLSSGFEFRVFPSPRLVALPTLENTVVSTILPIARGGGEEMDSCLSQEHQSKVKCKQSCSRFELGILHNDNRYTIYAFQPVYHVMCSPTHTHTHTHTHTLVKNS